jgi:tRNA 2-thiouridine synthesizing protein A
VNYLDTEGLKCPDPIRLLHQEMLSLNAGERVVMSATDPSTTRDVRRFCQFLSHDLIGMYQYGKGKERTYYFYMEVRGTG